MPDVFQICQQKRNSKSLLVEGIICSEKERGCSGDVTRLVNTVSCNSTPLLVASPLTRLQNFPCASEAPLQQNPALAGYSSSACQPTTKTVGPVVAPASIHVAGVYQSMDSPKNSHVSDAVRAIPSASQSDSPGTSSWPGSLGGPNSWSPRKSRPVNRTSAASCQPQRAIRSKRKQLPGLKQTSLHLVLLASLLKFQVSRRVFSRMIQLTFFHLAQKNIIRRPQQVCAWIQTL